MSFTFKGYDVGIEFTPGAPAGTSPPPHQRVVCAKAVMDYATAVAIQQALRIGSESIQLNLNLVDKKAHPQWLTMPTLGTFNEAQYDETP